MLSKLTISKRVLVLGLLPLIVLLFVVFASFWSAQHKDKLFNQLYDDHLVILSDVMAVQQLLQQTALQDIRKYRTGWASAEATVEVIEQHLTAAEHHWQRFTEQRPAQADAEFYAPLDQAFIAAIKHYREWISFAGTDALLVKILNESTINSEIERRILGLTALTEAFIQQQISAAVTVRDQSEKFTGQLVQVYVVGTALLFLLLSLLIWAVQRSVSVPLKSLRDLLTQVQQSSDLRLRADTQGRDEVSEAAQALNRMIDHFEQLVDALGSSASELSQQAESVFTTSDDVSQNSIRQAHQINQLATAIEEMSASVQDVAVNAKGAAEAAQQAETLCGAGRNVAAASAKAVTALADQLNQSAQVVQKLQQDSGQISTVLDVIRKISEQTNLLALNAAIEAARAGEAGRGFSVVADEVRTLSANTQQATQSIHQMISQLQSQAASAVDAMQMAHKDADHNRRLAQETGERFAELAGAVEKIANANISISSAASQQQAVVTDIADNIHLLNGDIQSLTHGAARSSSASEQLNALAMLLSQQSQVFTTSAKA